MFRSRFAVFVAVLAGFMSAGAGQALASHGGGSSGGGGGGTAPPPPATAPAVSLSPSTLTFGPQAVGTTSAPQIVTLTNTGTGSLFINGVSTTGLDFNRTDDQCVGLSIAPGASCAITLVFNPTATGSRTSTLSIVDNAASSPQAVTLAGTATSVDGPTPLSVDTTGLSCTSGVCQLGIPGDTLVKNFFFSSLGVLGQTAPPFAWTVVDGSLPPGLTLSSNGQISGTPTATGTFTYTVQVADDTGQTATQAFSQTISPQPLPLTQAQQQCQHAPSSTTATLAGPAIAGKTPSGQAIGDQSQLTACGGFTVITASVKDVNLPNGTILWVTLGGGEVIGRITLANGGGPMSPWTLAISTLRKQGIQVFTQPPTGNPAQTPILSGGFV